MTQGVPVRSVSKTSLMVAVVATVLLLAAATRAQSPTGTIVASANVVCPFALVLHTRAAYVLGTNALVNYTVNTLANCTISGMPGQLVVTNHTNAVFLSENLTANAVRAPATTNMLLPTSSFPNGTYTAKINFTYVNFGNESYAQFKMLSPANVVVTGISVPSVRQGAPLSVTIRLANKGQLASGNIIVYLNITGPSDFNFSYSVNALSPSQDYNLTITLNNVTSKTGSYTASSTANYITLNQSRLSGTATTSYSVTSQSSGGGAPPPAPAVTAIPSLNFTAVPFYTTIATGKSSIGALGFSDPTPDPEYVNVSIPLQYSNLASVSARSVYIKPGQSLSISVLLTAPAGVPPGLYVIPLNITTTVVNGQSASQVEYIALNVYSSNATLPILTQQIDLMNSTRTASGIITLVATPNSIKNAMLMTVLPQGVARSVDDLRAFGLPYNITLSNGKYVIRWDVAGIQASGTVYAYYTISNVTQQGALLSSQNLLAAPTQPSPQNLLKMLDVSIPTAYTSSMDNVTADLLYTGTAAQRVTVDLTAPPGTTVQNPTYSINASPNQLIRAVFAVKTGRGPGTVLLTLYASTNGGNLTYSLPLVVSQQPTTTMPTTTIPSRGVTVLPQGAYMDVILAIIVVVILAVIGLGLRRGAGPKYDRDRSDQLVRIRQRIKNEQ